MPDTKGSVTVSTPRSTASGKEETIPVRDGCRKTLVCKYVLRCQFLLDAEPQDRRQTDQMQFCFASHVSRHNDKRKFLKTGRGVCGEIDALQGGVVSLACPTALPLHERANAKQLENEGGQRPNKGLAPVR